MKYKITVSKGMANKVQKDDLIESWENPKFGRYWWFWLPKINWNGGRFSQHECVDIDVKWLCFWVGLIFWPQHA